MTSKTNTTTPSTTIINNELPKYPARFLTKLRQTPSGCWEYTGACLKDKDGNDTYGMFWDGKKQISAHRYAYLAFVSDDISEDQVIHHRCNNKKCANWESHLAVATWKENTQAAKRDGLLAVPHRTLRKSTPQEIAEIRRLAAAGVSNYKIAKQFDRSQPFIASVVNNRIHNPAKPPAKRGPKPAGTTTKMQEVA